MLRSVGKVRLIQMGAPPILMLKVLLINLFFHLFNDLPDCCYFD